MATHYRKSLPSADAALASEVFDRFCTASTMKTILGHFRHLCEILRIKPTNFPQFYPKLKVSISNILLKKKLFLHIQILMCS